MFFERIIEILAEFGAGAGNPENLAVRFLLAAFFWAGLAFTAYNQWREGDNRKDFYVCFAASVGLVRELFMFFTEYLAWRGVFPLEITFTFYPPVEHALSQINYIIHGSAFAYYFLGDTKIIRSYLAIGLSSVLLIFIAVFSTWNSFLDKHPDILFGHYPGDIYLHVYMSALTGFALFIISQGSAKFKSHVKRALFMGFLFFFLDDFLMIFSLAEGEVNRAIYAPVRHNFHIWAIPWFIYVYWQDLRDRTISSQHEAERERRKSEAILFAMGDGVAILDTDFRVMYQNTRHKDLLGSHIGRYCHQAFEEKEEACDKCPVAKTFEDGGMHTLEKENSSKKLHLVITSTPLKDSRGNITAAIQVVHDFTARKSLERRFSEAQRIEAMGRLAGGVAHDFNNLLTGIFGYCDFLLEDKSLGENHRKDVASVRELADKASGLTRQLLTYSRKQEVTLEPLIINDIIDDMIGLIHRLIGEDIDLEFNVNPHTGIILADKGLIEQVVMNLIVNARDAMPRGGKCSFATTISEDQTQKNDQASTSGRSIILSITDTGCGMDKQVLAKIFEPFFTTKEAGRGTGLGLSTVYGIVTQMNGHITVESEPGHGTTFQIYFPLLEENWKNEEQAFEKRNAPRPGIKEYTVLLVEDDDNVRQVIKKKIDTLGFMVLSASDGFEALNVSKNYGGPIHLLLTDVVMPKKNGRELANELLDEHQNLKTLYMSGYTEDFLMNLGVVPDNINLLSKPFSTEELLQRIHHTLNDQ